MQVFEKRLTLEKPEEPAILIPFGDVHLGAAGCNKSYLKNTIEWIKNKPNCYAVGLGDYLDCIIMNDKRFDIRSIDREFREDLDNLPMAQLDYLEKLLRPIRHKILCMIPGNHEEKFREVHSVDVMRELGGRLGVDIGDYMTFLRVVPDKEQFHNASITLWLNHGWFAGRKVGGKANNLTDVANSYEADIYITGHSHDLFSITTEKLGLAARGKGVVKEKKIFINSGCYLETVSRGSAGYAEKKAYPVAKIGSARIDIYFDKRPRPDIHVRV